jgi:hypothetical protein
MSPPVWLPRVDDCGPNLVTHEEAASAQDRSVLADGVLISFEGTRSGTATLRAMPDGKVVWRESICGEKYHKRREPFDASAPSK